MLPTYNSEIEGMRDFWNDLRITPDYELNTDGRYKGNLVEFKLVFTNLKEHKKQLKRYIKAYNSKALRIPKYSYLISINEHQYIKYDNETGEELSKGIYNDAEYFLEEFNNQDEYIKGWIDEYSIVSYNNKLCNDYKNYFKSKEDVKKEFIKPECLYIQPFDWDKQIKEEEENPDNIGWLHFNMNMLGPSLLKRQLGAFFTPDRYVKISTEMLREAIKQVPNENDYIILDRCAGTGNLERFLTEEELSHCVLNTYDYTEWTTLKGLYDGRVRMIIPPTNNSIDNNNGLLLYGDALSKEFYNFCFGSNEINIFDEQYKEQSKIFQNWIKDDKITILMLENPPFSEPQSGGSKGLQTFETKNKYLYEAMGKEKFDGKNANRASQNIFIWSAFKFFLKKPNDTYIVYSPIKYWKSQHIIDKKFIRGYICNKLYFNATESAVPLIEWRNQNEINEEITLDSDVGKRTIKKIYKNPKDY